MVRGAYVTTPRREAGVLEAEPVLVLPIATDVEVTLHFVVDADAAGYQIVSQVWPESIWQGGEVKDAAPIHHFAVRNKFAVGAEVTATDLVGLFVEIRRILDEMKLPFDADMREKVGIDVNGATAIATAVVRVCGCEAAAYLEIERLGSGGFGLSMERGCGSQQADEGDRPY